MREAPSTRVRTATRLALACVFSLGTMLALGTAQAQIAFRGAASTGVASSGITHIGAGNLATRDDCGNVNPSIPGGANGDVLIALVNAREAGATVTMPSWNQIYADSYPGQDFQVFVFWRFATGGDPNTVTQSGTCSSIGAQIARFRGADPTTPFQSAPIPAGNVVRQKSGDIDTGTETTTLNGSMLLVAAFITDNRTVTEGVGWSESFDSLFSPKGKGSRNLAISLHYQSQATAGPASISDWDFGGGKKGDENYGIMFALRPASTGFTINVPAGTVANDVMIATIAPRPCSATSGGACTATITAPAGWTLVRAIDQPLGGGTGGYGNQLSVYYRVASGAEPASYAWTIGGTPGNAGATGGIVSFSGVDTTSPIVAEGGQATAASYTHTAPGINTGAVTNTMLVSSHAANSAATWSPPGGMTEAVDVSSLGVPNDLGIALEMNYQLQAAAGPTGTRTATHSNPPNNETGAAHLLALRPVVSVNHYAITVLSTSVATCDYAEVTITAHNAAHGPVNPPASRIVTLNTSIGTGVWQPALVAGSGTWAPSGLNNGVATYQWPGTQSSFTVRIRQTAVTSLSVNLLDNAAIAELGTEDPTISFADSAFRISDGSGAALAIGTQISGKPSNTGFGAQALYLQAIRTDTSTGSCVSLFPNPSEVDIAVGAQCTFPAACTRNVTLTTQSGTGAATGVFVPNGAYPATIRFRFNTANSEAPFFFSYADAGTIALQFRYQLPTPPTGVYVQGSSNPFVVRPFGMAFHGVNAATPIQHNTTSGAPLFLAPAGDNFTMTLVGYQWAAGEDANDDGFPDFAVGDVVDITDNGTTPNFAWDTVVIPVVNLPGVALGTVDRASGGATALAGEFSGGAATIADWRYSEAGNVEMRADSFNYLVAGVTVLGLSGYDGTGRTGGHVGRFRPKQLALSGATLTNRSASACAPASVFTYMDELLRLDFTLTAQNTQGGTTQNYDGAYAKLNLAAPASFVFGVRDVPLATNLTPRLDTSLGTTGSWASGVAAGVQATLAVTRAVPDNPDGPYTQVKIGVAPSDSDGVALPAGALDFSTTGGANDRAQVGADTHVRFGRLRLTSAFGSELAPLTIPMQVEYWNGIGFLPNALDSCTTLARAAVTLSNYQGGLAACETAFFTIFTPDPYTFASGAAAPQLAAPGAGNDGSVDLRVNLGTPAGNACVGVGPGPGTPAISAARSYLRGRWNTTDDDGNPATNYDDDPVARASFGVYGPDRSSNRFIYRRENY